MSAWPFINKNKFTPKARLVEISVNNLIWQRVNCFNKLQKVCKMSLFMLFFKRKYGVRSACKPWFFAPSNKMLIKNSFGHQLIDESGWFRQNCVPLHVLVYACYMRYHPACPTRRSIHNGLCSDIDTSAFFLILQNIVHISINNFVLKDSAAKIVT